MHESGTLFKANKETLEGLAVLLEQIHAEDYANLSPVFGTASIGQHARHIIELYLCLIKQRENGVVSYDQRKRDPHLERDPRFALASVKLIQLTCQVPDRPLKVVQHFDSTEISTNSSYYREILYNIEHCVHHQALIKLACMPLGYLQLPEGFGVAKSTQTYRMSIEKSA